MTQERSESPPWSPWHKTPPAFLQQEATECGLACLAMIGAYYGVVEDLDDLRDRHPAPGRGSSLEWLATLAGRLGLNARSLEIAPDEIVNLQLPAVLHWDGNHWVVVVKTDRRGALLNDPALGQRWVTWTEIGTRFSRYALELAPTMAFERHAPRNRMKLGRFFANIVGLKRSVAELLLLAAILEFIALLTPYYLQLVIDQVLVTGDGEMLAIVTAATGALLLFQTVFSSVRSWMSVQFSLRTSRQLFSHVISHFLRLPLSFFSKRTLGDLTTRFDSLSTLAQAVTRTATEIFLEVFVLLAVLGMLLLYSLELAAMVLSGFMVMAAAKAYVFAASQRLVSEKTHFGSRRQSNLIETLRAIHAVKMARAEHLRADVWMRETDRIFRKDAGLEKVNVLSSLVLSTVSGLLHIAVIYWAARMILDKELTAGMLLAFLAYEQSFVSRGSSLVDKCLWLRTLKSHVARVSDIMFTAAEVQPDAPTKLPNPASVAIEGGAFRHSGEERYVFRDLSLSIDSGEMVGITGPSGIGKTTLLCVLAGIFPLAEGSVKYAGVAVSAERLIHLREHVAFVFQSDDMFEGTVSQNISFFAIQQEAEFIRECARLACIQDEILGWTHGFDTKLGEQGSRLSGGQRQRMLIARALYRRPAILFLDEATSQLDVATEKRVLGNIRSLGITVVLSAHRPTAMSECHRLVQLGPALVPPLAVERQRTA